MPAVGSGGTTGFRTGGSGLGRTFLEPLRTADYRRLWLGQLISVLGDKVDQIALGILVYEATGSELQMGIVLAIAVLPSALFGMLAGALVDRFDKRRTMLVADITRALLVLSVPFLAEVSLLAVYGVALLLAGMSLFFEPAKLSLIPELVPEEQLMAANSLDNITVSVAELAGLAFAAGLVASLGYRTAFFFDAATFLISALFVWSVRHRGQPRLPLPISIKALVHEVAEGMRYIRTHDVLRPLLPVYAGAMTGVAASVTFVYVLALDRFSAGAPGLALLDGAITVGLLMGGVLVSRTEMAGATRSLLGGLLAFGALLALSAVAPSIVWLVPLFFVMGIANTYFYVPMTTILQSRSLPSMRGRTMAAKQTLTRVLSVVGYVGAGLLAEAIGLSTTILAVSVLVTAIALLGWSRPALRAV